MLVVAVGDRLPYILPLDHVLLIELDDEVGAITGLHLDLLDGLDFN